MSTIKEQIMDYLSNEGLRPQPEDFGIYFRYQMLDFLIHWSDDDELYLSISLPYIFKTDENNRIDVLEAANRVSVDKKLIKCVIIRDDVWVVAEQLLDSTPNYEDIIPRTLGALLHARQNFYDYLKEA